MEAVVFQGQPTGPEAPVTPQVEDQSSQQQRPDWLPSNFKSPEDLAKSYAEAQAELTRTKQELAKLKPTGQQPPQQEQSRQSNGLTITDADSSNATASVDFTPYHEEFAQNGDVSPESRAKIYDSLKNVFGDKTQQIVDDYIDGYKVRTETTQKEFFNAAGGEENYKAITDWAKANLSREELLAYNRQVESGDYHTTLFAIQGLRARYEGSGNRPAKLITGTAPSLASEGFSSTYEMTQAMRDPRYGKDPAYTKMVEQRAMKSNF